MGWIWEELGQEEKGVIWSKYIVLNSKLIQIFLKSDALGKMPSTLRILLKYIFIKKNQNITNVHGMNSYTGQLWYTLTIHEGGKEQIRPLSRFPSNQLKLCILTWSSRPSMLFGRSHCTWLRLVDVPHCWHTKLETVITEIDQNILTASLLIFLAKQPHRINTSSLCKAHEQADYMSAGTVNDSLNPKNFLYIGRMLTFTVSWFS